MKAKTKRMYTDCREHPGEFRCTLYISGRRSEVLKAAISHAVEAHGHKNTPELKKLLSKQLKTEKN